MAQKITITVPDNCELQKNGNSYTIVEKERKLTYEDVARELFSKPCCYISTSGGITSVDTLKSCFAIDLNNCTSKKQAQKLLAINKLMNVAKYLNDGWQPDWNYIYKHKHYIALTSRGLITSNTCALQCGDIYFKSEELAKKAIEILGEETIKLALCTDY